MSFIVIDTCMNSSEIFYRRNHLPNKHYLSETQSRSEPIILYFSHQLSKGELSSHYDGTSLLDLEKRISKMSTLPEPQRKQEEDTLRNLISSHYHSKKQIEKFEDGDAFELGGDMAPGSLQSELYTQYVALPWNKVRLRVHNGDRELGYFICFGWSSLFNELYYSGIDFVPKLIKKEKEERLLDVPSDRGLPEDVLQTQANCGPGALAAYANISCSKAIRLLRWNPNTKKYTHTDQVLRALRELNDQHKLVTITGQHKIPSKAFVTEKAGIAYLRYSFVGGSPSDGLEGHFIAYDDGQVYDVNAIHPDGTHGNWIPENEWFERIVPVLVGEDIEDYRISFLIVPQTKKTKRKKSS